MPPTYGGLCLKGGNNMASIVLKNLYKEYPGGVQAVNDFNLEIEDKEFVVFVGPSGCGKSTTLRMIAGLEEITSGQLYIDGKLVNDVEPKDRDIAMVFQNYALYPHMSVYENMAFALRIRKLSKAEIDDKVKKAAEILGITEFLDRKPKALSGGQRQRVALGRAIVREPKVFLLDEPLSNLDAKLRVQMRTEITKLHKQLATTFVYVTHDQTEAMTMGSRIVVMKDGFIMQADTPRTLYDAPENKFVASFLGSPQMNFFENAVLEREKGRLKVRFGDNVVAVSEKAAKKIDELYIGRKITLGIRPEDIHDEKSYIDGHKSSLINAQIDIIENLGNEAMLYMNVDGKDGYTVARVDSKTNLKQGETAILAVDAERLHFFDNETEKSLLAIPKYNVLSAKLSEEDGCLVANTGGLRLKFPIGVDRLINKSCLNNEIAVGFSPEDFFMSEDAMDSISGGDVYSRGGVKPVLCDNEKPMPECKADSMSEKGADFVKIETAVDFVEEYPKFNAVYCKMEGRAKPLVVKRDKSRKYVKGDVLNIFVKLCDIKLLDAVSGEIITAGLPVAENKIIAAVETERGYKKNKIVFKFPAVRITGIYGDAVNSGSADSNHGRSSGAVYVREKFANGEYPVKISVNGGELCDPTIIATDKISMQGKIRSIDVLGKMYLVNIDIKGFEPYLTLIQKGIPKYKEGDAVKVILKDGAITKA